MTSFTAVIFDFDGTILDTETPVFESWRQTALRYDAKPVALDDWLSTIGLASDQIDPAAWVADLDPAQRDVVHGERRRLRDEMVAALEIRAGVIEWIDRAAALELPLGIASSSPVEWVSKHIVARGLIDRFQVLSCAGNGVPGKPDPAVYLKACAELGVDPTGALAIEDSPHGVSGAKAAGLRCIATPGPMTRALDFAHADHVADSLGDIDLDEYLPPRRR